MTRRPVRPSIALRHAPYRHQVKPPALAAEASPKRSQSRRHRWQVAIARQIKHAPRCQWHHARRKLALPAHAGQARTLQDGIFATGSMTWRVLFFLATGHQPALSRSRGNSLRARRIPCHISSWNTTISHSRSTVQLQEMHHVPAHSHDAKCIPDQDSRMARRHALHAAVTQKTAIGHVMLLLVGESEHCIAL